jgi:large subunit ribosomal protein L23
MKLEPRTVIQRVRLTEKGAMLREQGKKGSRYIFEVHPHANKIQIAQAIKEMFKVDADEVRTMNFEGKLKRLGRFEGRRAGWKKAIVTLKPGQTIDIFDEV